MANKTFFQTRARAIDHLGRGQIADCPTAVTELWKNAHDAYARQTSLHIFEGEPTVAAIFDDGCGMTLDDIIGRWLTIGTESKATSEVPKEDRLGLDPRPKLGEKGIGRLSAGFLAPVSLLVTKKKNNGFATAFVDWRFFENPFLLVHDIAIPCEEFARIEQLPKLLAQMAKVSLGNVSGSNAAGKADANRIREAWNDFSKIEKAEGRKVTTKAKIESFGLTDVVSEQKLTQWSVARGEVDHGTAIILIDLNHELAVWVDKSVDSGDVEAAKAKTDLKRTLTGFMEPECALVRDFSYHVETHDRAGSKIRLDSEDQITSEYLQSLEHYISGTVSEDGWFQGEVIAFGKQRGTCKFSLNVAGIMDKRGQSRVGEFSLEAATIEQDPKKCTHEPGEQVAIKKLQEDAGGMMVYRDGVRVLPYGRPDSDFFEIEDRRGGHAGREFWAHRRMFGRVFLSRDGNPKLRDKAGREGLVENESKRLMKELVIAVLKETARRYFGSASSIRKSELERIASRNTKGRESTKAARKIKRAEFLSKLRSATSAVSKAEAMFEQLVGTAERTLKLKDRGEIATALETIEAQRMEVEEISLPPLPKGLEEKEVAYRSTRDRIEDATKLARNLETRLATKLASLKDSEPNQIVESFRQSQLLQFNKQSKSLSSSLTSSLNELSQLWKARLSQSSDELDETTSSFVDEVVGGESVTWAINEIQAEVERFSVLILDDCKGVTNAVNLLLQGVDLDSALTVSDEGEMSANEKVQQLNLLAQSGIAVELISHELEELSSETEYNLKRIPDAAKRTAAFKRASSAFQSLVDRFRFLSPLSVATYRSRRTIKGSEISNYVSEFFDRRFDTSEVSFSSTKSFDSIEFSDVPSRIFPVFINLVNNSLYWLKFTKKKRQIRFDYREGVVIVADSGPGVDEEDVDNLFQMFFTKRPQGRGIGLYLCRANLAVARHGIHYAKASDPKILPGANFIIEIRGING